MNRKIALCFLFSAAFAFSLAALANEQGGRADSSDPPVSKTTEPAGWTRVIMQPTDSPRVFSGSEGKKNIVYEVILTNYNVVPAKIQSFKAIAGGASGHTLLDLSGTKLAEKFVAVMNKPVGTTLAPGQSGVVWVNVQLDEKETEPEKIVHELSYQTGTGKTAINTQYIGGELPVDSRAPVVIASPLKGKNWAAFGGYNGVLGHRRALFPIDNKLMLSQRYAIDWIKLDEENYSTKGDVKKVESSVSYGQGVYAVADGKVVGLVNAFPDQPPFKASGNIQYPGGNSLTLDIGDGLCAFYAHLKPGSILVHEGEPVKKGQKLADLGNSGNSTGPHLHFHITKGPKTLGSEGIPYVFESFELVGGVPDLKKFELNDMKGQKHTIDKLSPAQPRKLQLVNEGHIVNFSE